MSDDSSAELQQLVHAIKQNTSWSGQTTRELRDKIEEGSKHMAELAQVLAKAGQGMEAQLSRLATALEANAQRADRLRRVVWILIGVLAVAAVAMAGLIAAASR